MADGLLGAFGTKTKILGTIVIAIIIFIIAIVASSMQKLNSDQVGLRYNTILRDISTSASYEGLHLGPPGFTFIKFSSVYKTLDFVNLRCLNQDGVEINLDISFQYRIRPANIYNIVHQFKDQDQFEKVLEYIGDSSIYDACAKYNTSQFQADRGVFQEDLRVRLVTKFAGVSCDVTDLQVNDIRRPSEYESAVKRKEAAREDIEVARQERPRLLTEADTNKLEAETQAGIQIARAESDARIRLSQATLEGQAILFEYQKEADAYQFLTSSSGLNFNTESFLAYISTRVIGEAQNQVMIGMTGPAKTSYFQT